MNKRQTEKYYKNRFRKVFAYILSGATGMKIKPSRVRLIVKNTDDEHYMLGSCREYSLRADLKHA